MIKNTNENLVFSAAFDGGNEQLVQVASSNEYCFELRRNLCIDDQNGNLLLNETQRKYKGFDEYLTESKSKFLTRTPIEIHGDYTKHFMSAVLSALRSVNQREELAFFGAGNGFNRWLRWAKLFNSTAQAGRPENVRVFGFGKANPISEIRIELPMILTFQHLLDHLYTTFFINTYRPGRFGKDWRLYNLTKCEFVSVPTRNAKISREQINLGDDLAVLRLTPT